jgi:hypothetical protein
MRVFRDTKAGRRTHMKRSRFSEEQIIGISMPLYAGKVVVLEKNPREAPNR